MARFFFGNFEFEHRLAEPNRQLPAKLDRINAELATSWLAIAEDGDFLWTPQPIEPKFFEQAVVQGLPRVIPVVSLDNVPREVECVPWGWTDDIRRLCDKHGWQRNDPPAAAVRAANSRRMSATLEREWRVGLEFSGEVRALSEIERFIDLHGLESRWVIKAEFGMSGRERIVGSGELTEAQRNWVAKRLAADGAVFFEPWIERLDEVGIQIDVPRTGDPQLIEVVPLLVDVQGQYAGSIFASRKRVPLARDLMTGNFGVDIALRAARRLQDVGYFGPLGIDVMRYRALDQSIRLRPLQDINARWTMGRLSLGWKRLLKSRQIVGYWHHYSRKPTERENAIIEAVMQIRAVMHSRGLEPPAAIREMAHSILMAGEHFDRSALTAALEVFRVACSGNAYRAMLNDVAFFRSLSRIAASLVDPLGIDARRMHAIPICPDQVGGEQSSHRSLVGFE